MVETVEQGLRPLTGKVDAAHVHPRVSSVPRTIVERYLAIEDLTGTVSDALDEFGVLGAIAASTIVPRMPGGRIVGTVTTVRNEAVEEIPYVLATTNAK